MPAVRTATLEIAYEASGPETGPAVVLMHGFPDDVRTWDDVVPPLAQAGCRVLVPWLRGYGATRFRDRAAPRSGQQAALGADLLDFLDALGIARAGLAGYDWGGRACCVVAALWSERVSALVSIGGYNIQDIAASLAPAGAVAELRFWYQWYFNTARGREGLARNRREIARLLWRMWSPNLKFDDATFDRTAASWDNPDYVDVVVQSYRHRYQAAPGDPALEPIEQRLALRPVIPVPTIVLEGMADGVDPPTRDDPYRDRFTGPYQRRLIPEAGHFLPREAPGEVVRALHDLGVGSAQRH
jgi:pimeloyl-ACP methyl ester carboxylesterase